MGRGHRQRPGLGLALGEAVERGGVLRRKFQAQRLALEAAAGFIQRPPAGRIALQRAHFELDQDLQHIRVRQAGRALAGRIGVEASLDVVDAVRPGEQQLGMAQLGLGDAQAQVVARGRLAQLDQAGAAVALKSDLAFVMGVTVSVRRRRVA